MNGLYHLHIKVHFTLGPAHGYSLSISSRFTIITNSILLLRLHYVKVIIFSEGGDGFTAK